MYCLPPSRRKVRAASSKRPLRTNHHGPAVNGSPVRTYSQAQTNPQSSGELATPIGQCRACASLMSDGSYWYSPQSPSMLSEARTTPTPSVRPIPQHMFTDVRSGAPRDSSPYEVRYPLRPMGHISEAYEVVKVSASAKPQHRLRKRPHGMPQRRQPAKSIPREVEKTGTKMVQIIAAMPHTYVLLDPNRA